MKYFRSCFIQERFSLDLIHQVKKIIACNRRCTRFSDVRRLVQCLVLTYICWINGRDTFIFHVSKKNERNIRLNLSKYLCTFLMRTETHALGKQKGHETTIFFTMHLQQCVLVQCNTNGKKKLKMQALQSSQYFFHYMKSFLHLSKNALSQRKCP